MNAPSPPPGPETPLVSVVTATRNRPLAMVRRALDSIIAQDLKQIEIILVDDGSTAQVLAEQLQMRTTLDSRLVVDGPSFPGAPGTGPAAARNRGVRRARGEFIAFLDDDDRWIVDDHLSTGVEILQRSDADLFIGNMRGEVGDQISRPEWFADAPQLTAGPRLSERPAVYEVSLSAIARTARHYNFHPNSCIVRRSLVERVGLFWERIDYGEDVEWILRMADAARKVLYRADHVAGYNQSPRNSMSTRNTKIEQLLQAVVGAQRLQITCTHRQVRRCARSTEAWNLRQLAKCVQAQGRPAAAVSLMWQAVCIYPTAGAALDLLKSMPLLMSPQQEP